MSDPEDISARSGAAGQQGSARSQTQGHAQPQAPAVPPVTAFHRRELDLILRVYGQKVAAGEWRDYAIDHLKDRAIFSVFRRSSEMPLYRIEKVPRNARRQGAFAVVGAGGTILKRGGELAQVLKVFEKRRHLSLV